MPISSKKSLNKLKEEVTTCKKCLDLVRTRKQSVPGTGASNSKIMIIGHYPTEKGAEASGIPFTNDDNGKLIREILNALNLSLEENTYLTYLIKCTPRKVARKNGKEIIKLTEPAIKHINNCINFLIEEISVITPHIIISLGLEITNVLLENFFSIEKKYTDINKLHMRLFENPSFKLMPFYGLEDISKKLISKENYLGDFKSLSKLLSII